jgi:hypothetical protein
VIWLVELLILALWLVVLVVRGVAWCLMVLVWLVVEAVRAVRSNR